MSGVYLNSRFNPWAVAVAVALVLGIGGAVVYGLFIEKDAPHVQPPRMATVEAEHLDTKALVAVAHTPTPTPTPMAQPSTQPQAQATPNQLAIERRHRREQVYASAGLVGGFHSGNTLTVGQHNGSGVAGGVGDGAHGVGLEGPRSPYTLMAGGLIIARLVDGIDTDLNGPIRATITEPVYNTLDHRYLLIPQRSLLIGKYESTREQGQTRVDVHWLRLILPDTSSMDLPELPSDSPDGYPGLHDITDHHYAQRFALASVLGLVGIGSSVGSMGLYGGGAYSYQPNGAALALNAAGQGIGQRLGQEGQTTLQENMTTKPTNYIRPGFQFNVFVNVDLVFPHEYGHPAN